MPRKKRAVAQAKVEVDKIDGVTVEGTYPKIDRVRTGLWSLDKALGGGWPTRIVSEIFGPNDSCKSTLSYFVAARIATEYSGDIIIGDLEGLNPNYVISVVKAAGFGKEGKIRFVPSAIEENGKTIPAAAEDFLKNMIDWFAEGLSSAAILDSVSMVASVQETEGEIGNSNMGRRAFIMSQTIRAAHRWLRNKEKPGVLFLVNHQYPILGFVGTTTPGGEMVHLGSAVRVQLKVAERTDSDARIVNGKIVKLRFRAPDIESKEFSFCTIPDYGIHVGLTSIQDCVKAGLAEETSGRISMGGKSYGWWKKLTEDYADQERFMPFVKAINSLY